MVDEPKPAPALTINNRDAPVIFFDAAPTMATFNGVVALSLTAMIYTPTGEGKPNLEQKVVAHLRTNIQGAKALQAAVEGGLLLAQPVEGQQN